MYVEEICEVNDDEIRKKKITRWTKKKGYAVKTQPLLDLGGETMA